MHMGRQRSRNPGWPRNFRKVRNSYYYDTGSAGKRRTGKREYIPLGNVFAAAMAKWAQIEGDNMEAGSTLGHALDRFLREVAPLKAAATAKEYLRQGVRIRAVFGELPLADLRPVHIKQYLDKHPRKTLANREVALLSTVYSHARSWGWIDAPNPCFTVRRNKEPKRERYITDDELRALRAAASDQIGCIIDLAYITGMRKRDLLRLRLADLQDDGIHIKQSKTGKRQIFEWTEDLRAVVAAAKALRRRVGSLYLFANRQGQPYTTSGFDSMWVRVVRRSGIEDVRFHDLRAKAGSDSDQATKLLGHADQRTTQRYRRRPDSVRPLKKL